MLCAGCTAHVVPLFPPSKVTAQAQSSSPPAESAAVQPASSPAPAELVEAGQTLEGTAAAVVAQAEQKEADLPSSLIPDGAGEEEADADDDEPADAIDTDEGEAQEAGANAGVPNGPLYTAELSDEQLTELWKKEPTTLGSISVGFVESGRMVNAVRVPQGGEDWLVVSPELAWGTQETVDYLTTAIREVRAKYPKAPPLRVNQLSSREGGYLRPHKSHQNGRDVDLGFYYPTAEPIRVRERERYINLELNWALLKSLATHADVQMILVDKRVQKVLYDFALRNGEDKAWLDSLFNAGAQSLVKHAKRHRDHFHVRFFNPRAQELGRRIAPLLALQPDKNIVMHRVRSGNTLGAIALRYGSSVQAIQRANRMRGTFLRLGQVLAVPLRGPCTRCPVPAPLVVPPRRLPPQGLEQQAPAVAQQAPATAPAPAAEAQAPVAAEQQPAVAQQEESTGGSDPVQAESPTQEQVLPTEAPQQEPAGESTPADTHTSAAVLPEGTSTLR
jgi:murein endopeptidase